MGVRANAPHLISPLRVFTCSKGTLLTQFVKQGTRTQMSPWQCFCGFLVHFHSPHFTCFLSLSLTRSLYCCFTYLLLTRAHTNTHSLHIHSKLYVFLIEAPFQVAFFPFLTQFASSDSQSYDSSVFITCQHYFFLLFLSLQSIS